MENTNQGPINPFPTNATPPASNPVSPAPPMPAAPSPANPAPVPGKRRTALIIMLVILMTAAGGLVLANSLSDWKCVDGEWVKEGFPLSGKPRGACEKNQAQKPAANTENNSVKTEAASVPSGNFEKDGIVLTSPKSGDTITSPLIVEGRARGTWYFEGDFPVKIADDGGNIIAYGYARAEGEWMTESFVPFRGEVRFSTPPTSEGSVVFSRDDPSGMAKNLISVSIPVKFGKSSEEASGSQFLESACGHDPMNDPIMGDCGEDCNVDNWKVYKSKKYGYSFRYPANYELTNECKNNSCVSVEEGGDVVYVDGENINGGWPLVGIRHLQNEYYNPPADADIPGWIKKKFSWTEKCFPGTENIYLSLKNGGVVGGWNVYFPQTPQAYSQREIFYERGGKIFQLIMLDVDSPQARQFYNIWLSTFNILGE